MLDIKGKQKKEEIDPGELIEAIKNKKLLHFRKILRLSQGELAGRLGNAVKGVTNKRGNADLQKTKEGMF